MRKYLTIIAVIMTSQAFAAEPASEKKTPPPIPPLRDGYALSAIDGEVTVSEKGDKWFFAPETGAADDTGKIVPGQIVELLPSSALEKLAAAMGDNKSMNIRLWARVTRYCNRNVLLAKLPSRKFANRKVENKKLMDAKFLNEHRFNKNYLFPIYFIPLTESEPVDTDAPAETDDDTKTDEDSIIPEDILKELTPKRVVDLGKLNETLKTKADVMLANRTGFVIINDNEKTFTVDALGRNIDDLSFKLLPCEALEATEKSLVETPIVRQRFRVSGIVTSFKGTNYMLLQRTNRTYSHGNFSR